MTPIDLVDYTDSSEKIPAEFLEQSSLKDEEVKTSQVLLAHLIDLFAVISTSMMVSQFLKLSFGNYMMTRSLARAFNNIQFSTLTLTCLPLFFISYFFFSFFFNQGQSWGMKVMKNRITMKELDFKSSFTWAMISSLTLMTMGVSLIFGRDWVKQKGWGDFKGHDHLYILLMQERFLSPVNVVELASQHQAVQASEEEEEETYLQAA